VPSFTKKEPKDGMITGFSKKSSRKETKFFYLTPRSSYSVKENFGVNGKGWNTVVNTSSHGAITIQDDKGNTFKANSQRLKVFLEPSYNFNEKIDIIKLIDFKKYPNKSASKNNNNKQK
jgi:hypothetical protein